MTAHRRLLYAILAGYVVLATTYSIVTPPFEASDELWHYPMVNYLADNGLQLPPQDPANPGPWRQEGSQPPLYYFIGAILTAGIDTSDMAIIRRINPHADIGVVRPDGNANMIVHRIDAEAFPWSKTSLAVHLIRFFSVLLGLGTVLVTYQLGREIFPDHPVVALGAAALNAFLPMFLFISGSVNNDNLSTLLGNWLTLLIVRLLKSAQRQSGETAVLHWRQYALIGVVTGAGLLAKFNIGFLIPVVALALLIASLRTRDWRPLVIGGLLSGGLTIAIAGWWYIRNNALYGDPTGLNMFLQLVGRRAIPANAAQLWSERHSFTQAFWGFFGGVNVPLPEWVYLIFNIIGGVGLTSAMVFIGHTLTRRRWAWEQWLPAAVTILWPVVTFISYLRWTAETPASQGRLMFGALSSILLWMAAGLVVWLPQRARGWVMGSAAGYFALIAVLTPFLVIAPAYTPPEMMLGGESETTFAEPDGGGRVGLVSGQVITDDVRPEEYVMAELEWHISQPLMRDWSLFAHVVTPEGVIVGQRDIYPGGGTLATSDLSIESTWRDQVAIWIPAAAYAPMTLDVVIGWYHLPSGKRLEGVVGETVTIGQVELLPREDDPGVPNPIRVNFGNRIELVGYSLTDLSPAAGDTIELTLYWRGMQPIDVDYKVFANILNPTSLTKYASSDGMPVQWQAPTSTWTPGAIIEDTHLLTVDPAAPPGMYEVELGLYLQTPDGAFERLRVVTPDGGMANDFIYLSRVRTLPPEDN